jgi:hypothetical protein
MRKEEETVHPHFEGLGFNTLKTDRDWEVEVKKIIHRQGITL